VFTKATSGASIEFPMKYKSQSMNVHIKIPMLAANISALLAI